jgi:hypothetical protein
VIDICVQNECVLCVDKYFCQKVKDNEQKIADKIAKINQDEQINEQL